MSTRAGEGPITILANEDNSCFDSGSETPVVRVCSGPKFCESNACVRKCCPEGESMVNDECVWTTPFPVAPGTFHKLLMNESITRGSAMAKAHSLKFMQTPGKFRSQAPPGIRFLTIAPLKIVFSGLKSIVFFGEDVMGSI